MNDYGPNGKPVLRTFSQYILVLALLLFGLSIIGYSMKALHEEPTVVQE